MESYHNTISDKLVVCTQATNSLYLIFSKENVLKYASDSVDIQQYIFNQTHHISLNAKFVLMPAQLSNHADFYTLSHGHHNALKTETLEEVKVVYDDERRLPQMVNPSHHCDISLLVEYALGKKKNEAIYFYQVDDELSLVCIKDGKLFLANRYEVVNNEELFYYIMLVVDQGKLDAANLHLECITTSGVHESFLVLFKNYLPNIHKGNASHFTSEAVAQKNPVQVFLAQCVL